MKKSSGKGLVFDARLRARITKTLTMTFLQAEWRKLILINYPVSEKVLHPHIPYRTELDPWNGMLYGESLQFDKAYGIIIF